MSYTYNCLSGSTWKNQFLDSIKDPMTSMFLTQAVTLSPCCHKINEATAKKIFNVDPAKSVQKPCPMCKKNVESYHADHTMRGLVNLLLARKNDGLEDGDELPKTCAKIDSEPCKNPFPGKGGKFVCQIEDVKSGSSSFFLQFVSQNKDSLIKKFMLSNVINLRPSIYIEFSAKNAKEIIDYLEYRGCEIDPYDRRARCRSYSADEEDLPILLKILTEYNDIPNSCLEKINECLKRPKLDFHRNFD